MDIKKRNLKKKAYLLLTFIVGVACMVPMIKFVLSKIGRKEMETLFELAAGLGIVTGCITGSIFVFLGVLGLIKGQRVPQVGDMFPSRMLLILLGAVIVAASGFIITETLMLYAEVVFAVIGVVILWRLPKVNDRLARVILAIFGFFTVIQPLHYLLGWLLICS